MAPTVARSRRSPAGVLGDALLWLAAIGGALCIAGVIAATVFHVNLIMFKTGSMEPTIPTGSLAVVHEIPATAVRVGDIVTVDRPGLLPVTHRVIAVDGAGSTRALTLQGDANPVEDPAPYLVERVRLVWAWVPGWANVVVWFSNPAVLGALTLGATALVTWAFWPRDERRGRRRAGRGRLAGPGAGVALIAVALAVAGPVPPAHAAETETVVTSGFLTLTSIADAELMASMDTGDTVPWQVGILATPPDPGDVHIGLAATGALASPGIMTIRVDACPERWVAGACGPGATTWLPPTDLSDAVAPVTAHGAHEVGSFPSDEETWLLISVTLDAAVVPSGAAADLRLQAWGVGTLGVGGSVTNAGGTGGLALTGQGSVMVPVAMALGGILTGIAIAASARRRSRA
ncbi:MAG TPA: signal peptidase I [Pseudolysinimonas sp.]|nr:signal peptidase I [Pseudolysinimonas sp.]